MPEGLVRTGDFRDGTPITLPHEFGNPVTWSPSPAHFGNLINWLPNPAHFGNAVTWAPNPAHFGNIISPTPTQDTPTFTPVGGSYGPTQNVVITSAGADAIYYTTDGSTPTIGSTLYTGAVSVSVSETLKALAVKAGSLNSAIGTASYTINGTQATPTFSPVAGSYTSIQSVTITSSGADTIYYTTDGSTPTTGSTVYSGPLSVAVSETVKALAVRAGYTNSAIGSAAYVISLTSGFELEDSSGVILLESGDILLLEIQ